MGGIHGCRLFHYIVATLTVAQFAENSLAFGVHNRHIYLKDSSHRPCDYSQPGGPREIGRSWFRPVGEKPDKIKISDNGKMIIGGGYYGAFQAISN